MTFTRDEHWQFLEEELKAQTETFKQKLGTSALYLLQERQELFVAQYLKFEDGELILKFSNNRSLPRLGEYLYCFTVQKELRNYRNWDNKTYGDLIKEKINFTELVCIWQSPSRDNDFSIAGFRGVELSFSSHIEGAEGIVLILGPNKPPYEYIANLQKVVLKESNVAVNKILDHDYKTSDVAVSLLDNKRNLTEFVLKQLALQDTLILQGPPGTGKTHLIAEICAELCNQGKTVLVTALTNRALIEIVEKPALNNLLLEKGIFKTKLSVDELNLYNDLQKIKEITPIAGSLILSTFYITSGKATEINGEPPFDYVIVDEASQALLAMFASSKILGKKNIWIGDFNQLPPVTVVSDDKVNRKNYNILVDGLKSITRNSLFPIFQLSETYRLTERGAEYTSFFYNNVLVSKSPKNIRLTYNELNRDLARLFNSMGGPTLIKTDLPIGDLKPKNAMLLITAIVKGLLSSDEKLHISVLTYFVETTKALQRSIFQSVGYQTNLLIDTVSRVQGLTTDLVIYFIPNSGYHRSLESRLFNVATSRSKRHTLIVSDNDIQLRTYIDKDVKMFLEKLNNEFSFYIKPESDLHKLI